MLECATCGAAGEANFSTNYFGELVCELCGTQSFQQARNETQDVDDMAMDATRVSRTHKRASRRRKRGAEDAPGERRAAKARRRAADVELLDCLLATQSVLEHQVRALMTRVGGFPPEYPRVVRDLWFQLLECWESKADRPLLRSYTEYFLRRSALKGGPDDPLDHAMTQDLLAQWDAERQQTDNEVEGDGREAGEDGAASVGADGQVKGKMKAHYEGLRLAKLQRIGLVDLLAIMWLAARVLSLPLLPCDFTDWVLTGELPYANLLTACCSPELRERIADVGTYFETAIMRNRVSTVKISYKAHCLQYNMQLRLPPLNAPMVAYRMVEDLGLPPLVFRNFQWVTALMNVEGEVPESPLISLAPLEVGRFVPHDLTPRMLDSSVGIAAHLLVAIKMCPNWFSWVFERVTESGNHAASSSDTAPQQTGKERLSRADLEIHGVKVPTLPRRQLAAFLTLCEQSLVDPARRSVPDAFAKHAVKLQTLEPRRRDSNRSQRRQRDEPSENYRPHELHVYPPLYEHGVYVETDAEIEAHLARCRGSQLPSEARSEGSSTVDEDNWKSGDASDEEKEAPQGGEDEGDDVEGYFYPVYIKKVRPVMHPVYESMLAMVCEYVDVPMNTVTRVVQDLDIRMAALCHKYAKRPENGAANAEVGAVDQVETGDDEEEGMSDTHPRHFEIEARSGAVTGLDL